MPTLLFQLFHMKTYGSLKDDLGLPCFPSPDEFLAMLLCTSGVVNGFQSKLGSQLAFVAWHGRFQGQLETS